MTDAPARWMIQTDVQFTRRKRFHTVRDPSGAPVFHARLFGDCVDYLDAEDVTEYDVRGSDHRRHLSTWRLEARKAP